jgi:hypothetical protein
MVPGEIILLLGMIYIVYEVSEVRNHKDNDMMQKKTYTE